MTHNLLVITHDDVETLDRRIVNEARLFRDHGWSVQVLCLTTHHEPSSSVIEPNIFATAIPICRTTPPRDPLFENWSDATETETPNRSWLQRLGKRLSYHVGCHPRLHRLMNAVRQSPRRIRQSIKQQIRFHLAPYPRLQNTARKLLAFSQRVKSKFRRTTRDATGPTTFALSPDAYPMPFTESFIAYGQRMEADAIMACDLPALPAAHELAERWDVPLIYDAHEYYVEQAMFGPRQRFVMEQHEARCLQRTDLFMTVSDLIADDIQRKYDLRTRPKVLYNASAFQRTVATGQRDIRNELNIPDDAPLLLHHGGLFSTRNLDRLISGFAKVASRNEHLVIIGYGDHKQPLTRLANNVGHGRIQVRDAVPQIELPDWINVADAVVIPYPATEKNNEYCMPNKLSDCIELGCPMIANSGLLCISDILKTHRLGVSGPMDTDEDMAATLRRGLQWLMDGEDGNADFASARKIYGADTQREKLTGWLQELQLPGFVAQPTPSAIAA